mgnify:FL=1
MDRDLKKIIVISAIVLIFGGFGALATMWESVFQIIVAFFPFICEAGKMALEEYLTSPYFIVGVIMSIGSAFGIWFGAKGGRALLLIVSIICETASLVSIGSNII